MAKGSDLRTFGSPPRNPLEIGIAASNGLAFSDSHLSRFSAQHKELQTDLKPSSRQSLLSKEFSNSSLYDEVDKGNNMKQDASITEVSPNNTSNDKFHFSIYKWASKGVPWSMPLRTERTSRTKDKFKLEKSSSVKEWIVTEITAQNDSLEESMVSEITIANDSPIIYNGSSSMRNKKQDVLTASTTTHNKIDSHQTVDHIVSAKPRSDSLSSRQTLIKDVLDSPISSGAKTESSTHSTSESVFYEKNEVASETQKNEIKSLHSLFSKSNVKQGKSIHLWYSVMCVCVCVIYRLVITVNRCIRQIMMRLLERGEKKTWRKAQSYLPILTFLLIQRSKTKSEIQFPRKV
jgi:hypothetical protein